MSTFAGSLNGVPNKLDSGNRGSSDGMGTSAQFYSPDGVCLDSNGNLYVADANNNKIRKISGTTGLVSTFAGASGGSADGVGSAARFWQPMGVAVDLSGNVYVADSANNKIRKITPAATVATFAGSGVASGNDGTGTSATF